MDSFTKGVGKLFVVAIVGLIAAGICTLTGVTSFKLAAAVIGIEMLTGLGIGVLGGLVHAAYNDD